MLTQNWMTCGLIVMVFPLAGCSDGGSASTETSGETTQVAAAGELWCNEHGVEEKYCVLCHPEIKEDPEMLLCAEHGDIPEAICTACHPELKEKYETCPHELPPAFCQTCAGDSATPQSEPHDHESHNDEHQKGSS